MKAPQVFTRLGWGLILLGVLGGVGWWSFAEHLVRGWLGTDLSFAPDYIRLHATLDPARDLEYFIGLAVPAGYRFLVGLVALGIVFAATPFPGALIGVFGQTADARTLALARIVVFGSLALYVEPGEVARFAALPSELLRPPPGWGWFLDAVPISVAWGQPLAWIVVLASGAAALGLWWRVTPWLALGAAVFALGIPQFFGKINHYHHLLWFGAVLAASPAADAWSVSGRSVREAGRRYGRPLRWVWVLFGLVYFFPGFWKWVVAGPDWFSGEALATMVQAQWYREGITAPVRVDQGLWAAVSGTWVLIFEIGFVFALAGRRSRWTFAAGAAVFHLTVFFLVGISFWSLAICLVVFLPLEAWLPARPAGAESGSKATDRMGGVLVGLALLSGFAGIDTWPVAVYPTFAAPPDSLYATLLLETDSGDRIDPFRSNGLVEAFGQSRIMGLAWQTVGSTRSEARSRAVVDVFSRFEPRLAEADTVRVFEIHLDVTPETGRIVRERLLAEVVR